MFSVAYLALVFAQPATSWQDDYSQAKQQAVAQKKDLMVYFHENGEMDEVLQDAGVQAALAGFVCLKAPVGYEYGGRRLIDYPAFEDMMGKPGLSIISLSDQNAAYYHQVVSAHPLVWSRYSWVPRYGVEEVKTILTLPPGTLTQRSMIYAVRVHPERPQSVYCNCHPAFLAHCERHCAVQASSMVQHHANIIAASHRLQGETGEWLSGASEVVAESWGRFVGGENVLEAAFSCIDAWRQSPGHWGAVSRSHRFFGYDIAQGGNGTWYATGVFAN